MSKRKITYGETVKKMLRDAGANEALRSELFAVQVALARTTAQSVTVLIKLLKTSACRETQWLIGRVLGTIKDPRAIKPLMKATLAPENEGYSCNFLWPLENFDCTAHVGSLVGLLVSRKECDEDEVTWACITVIRKMKGPFEPVVARRNIRKLLAEPDKSLPEAERTALAAFRLEAAECIMAKYFNQTLKTFWNEWNKR